MRSPASASPSDLEHQVPGIELAWLFVSGSLRISRWCCQAKGPDLSDERSQPWHVLGFTHVGAYEMQVPGARVIIDPTVVTLTSPGVPYRTAHPFGCGDRGSSVVLQPRVLREIVANYDPALIERDPVRFRFPLPAVTCSAKGFLLQRLLFEQLSRPNEADLMRIEEIALSLAEATLRECFRRGGDPIESRPSTRRTHREVAEAARGLLIARFREPLRLDDIAQALYVSPSHLARIFKRETGLPIHRYLNRLRLRAALDALSERGQDLTSLAFELGFSSHSHFTSSFGQEFGLTPSQVQHIAVSGRLPEPLGLTSALGRRRAGGAPGGPRGGGWRARRNPGPAAA